MLYWEAKGPALDAYRELLPKMLEILKEKQGALPNSDIIWFGLYMVGPDMDNAMPHVMFTGENKTARKKALKIVKESGLLAGHPGMHVGQWAEPRHIGSQAPCVGSSGNSIPFLDDDGEPFSAVGDSDAADPHDETSFRWPTLRNSPREDVVGRSNGRQYLASVPSGIEYEQFITGSRRSTILKIKFGIETVRATSSLVWESEGAEYCLTAAHVFFRPSSQVDPDSPQPDTDSSEYEFDGFPDNDFQDNSPMGTSEGSLTAPPSESSDERLSTSSISPLFQEMSDLTRAPEDEIESQALRRRAYPPDSSSSPLSQALSLADISGSSDHHYTTSAQLDYTLQILPKKEFSGNSHGMQILTSSVIIEPTEQGSKAQVHTSHGILSGVIEKAGTHVLLPGSTGYQEVYVAYLDSPVEAGDSGAVVTDETDHAYGHIVSGSSTSAAFVMPLRQVYDAIARISQIPSHSRLDSHGQPYDEQPHGYDILHFSDENSYAEPSWVNPRDKETTRLNAHLRSLEGHTGFVRSTAISASANVMSSLSADASILAWSIKTGRIKQRFTGFKDGIQSLSISANGKFLATAMDTTSVQILCVETGSIHQKIAVDDKAGPVDSLAISSNGRLLATRQLVQSETTTGEQRQQATVSIWNVSDGTKEKDLLFEDTNASTPMAITRAGRFVAALAPGSDRDIWKWDVTGGEEKLLKGHEDRINSLVISHDGIFIITASDDKTVRVWDVRTGTELRVLVGHSCPVKLVAISKNSEYIISASEEGMVRIWDWRAGVEPRIVQDYGGQIQALAVSMDGQFVMSASKGNIVHLWDEQTVRLRRTRSWISMSSSNSVESDSESMEPDQTFAFKDQDPTPRAGGDAWQFKPSLLDP